MGEVLVCWKCGTVLDEVSTPLSRRDECRVCGAELHVCRMCAFYAPEVAGQCTEDRAEDVTDKERANFCDYFLLVAGAYHPQDEAAQRAARAELDALFGNRDGGSQEGTPGTGATRAQEDLARTELERLFGAAGPAKRRE